MPSRMTISTLKPSQSIIAGAITAETVDVGGVADGGSGGVTAAAITAPAVGAGAAVAGGNGCGTGPTIDR
jgi:hypothetical protein